MNGPPQKAAEWLSNPRGHAQAGVRKAVPPQIDTPTLVSQRGTAQGLRFGNAQEE